MARWICKGCVTKPAPKSRPCPQCCGWLIIHVDLPNNHLGLPYRQPKRAKAATKRLRERS